MPKKAKERVRDTESANMFIHESSTVTVANAVNTIYSPQLDEETPAATYWVCTLCKLGVCACVS
jgi:hypothetical protein